MYLLVKGILASTTLLVGLGEGHYKVARTEYTEGLALEYRSSFESGYSQDRVLLLLCSGMSDVAFE